MLSNLTVLLSVIRSAFAPDLRDRFRTLPGNGSSDSNLWFLRNS